MLSSTLNCWLLQDANTASLHYQAGGEEKSDGEEEEEEEKTIDIIDTAGYSDETVPPHQNYWWKVNSHKQVINVQVYLFTACINVHAVMCGSILGSLLKYMYLV